MDAATGRWKALTMHLWLASPLLRSRLPGLRRKKILRNGKRKELFSTGKELPAKRKEPFHAGKELSAEGKERFSVRKELPAQTKEPFHVGKELSAKGKEGFSAGKKLPAQRKELPAQRKQPFHAGKQGFAAGRDGFSAQALLSPAATRLCPATACRCGMALLLNFPQAARTAAGLLPSRRMGAGCRRSPNLQPAT